MPKAKPRKQKLKVFRTPIGFHDAFVAAPSRKAALEAWGATTDLFSAGIAEEVKDEKLTKAPLERPGEVIRQARKPGRESVPEVVRKKGKSAPDRGRGAKAKKEKKKPKPSRAALAKAEAALAALEKKQSAERGKLEGEEQALANRRQALREKHRKARGKAIERRDDAEERFRAAMAKWEG